MQSKAVLMAVLASLAIAAPGHPHRRGGGGGGGAAERVVRPRDPTYPTAPQPPADAYPVDPYPVQLPSPQAPQGEEYPVTRTTTTTIPYATPSTTTRTTTTTTTPYATPSTTTRYSTTTIPAGYSQGRPTTQPFSTLPLPEGYPQSRPTTTTTTAGYSLRPTQSSSPPPPTDGGKDKNKACGTSLPMCCETTLLSLAGVTCKPSSNKNQSSKDLQKECAAAGFTAKCCATTLLNLPVGLVCTDPLKDSK